MFICRRITQTSIALGLPSGIMLTLLVAASLFSSQSFAQPFVRGFGCDLAAISHDFEPGHHIYRMSGDCLGEDDAWDITIDVEWFGKDNRVHERIQVGKFGGELWATCPADPVIDDGRCSNVSYSGIYGSRFDEDYSIARILLSRKFVSDDQKSQIRTALVAAFPAPSIDHPLRTIYTAILLKKRPANTRSRYL